MRKKQKPQWLIGIDEAGRGSLAGPVSVGGVLVQADFDFSIFTKVADSKQLSPQKRGRRLGEVGEAGKKRHPPHNLSVLGRDGSLYAPKEYTFQKTIIKGDVTELAISLASIMAKVTRDKKMVTLAK